MPICCVKGCKNRFVKDGPVKFFRFPVDRERRSAWLASVSRDHWQPTCWSGVCGEHFVDGRPDGDSRSTDYVPTLKMGIDENTNVLANFPAPSAQLPKEEASEDFCKDLNSNFETDLEIKESLSKDANLDQCSNGNSEVEEGDPLLRSPLAPLTRKRRTDDQITLRMEINILKRKIRALEDLNDRTKFGENFLRGDDYRTSYLTGIPTYTAFCWLLSVCHSVLPKSRFLSPGDTLIMVLSKLKLELPSGELSGRYNITEARAEQIVSLAVPLLTKKVQGLSEDRHVAKLPEEFKQGVYRVLLLLTIKNA